MKRSSILTIPSLRSMNSQLHFFLGLCLLIWIQITRAQDCPQAVTCDECISTGPECTWCKDKYFDSSLGSRCGTRAALKGLGCGEKNVVDPVSKHTVQDERMPGSQKTANQLRPKNLTLELRPGKPHSVEINVKHKTNPVGIYYLTSSNLMGRDSLYGMGRLGEAVLSAMMAANPEARGIGFGVYGETPAPESDETMCTVDSSLCESVFSFRHSPTVPEIPNPQARESAGALLALQQATVCRDIIDWGSGARLIVFVSDQIFLHAENQTADSKNTLTECLLRQGSGLERVNPSIADLRQLFTENNVQTIFAVTENVASKYRELSDLLPKSTVAVLTSDPTLNVVAIKKAYRVLSRTVVLSHTRVPGLSVSYLSDCSRGTRQSQLRGLCEDIPGSAKVSFIVTASSGPDSCEREPVTFHLQLMGSPEYTSVQLRPWCRCECGDQLDPELCSYEGDLKCGVCSCNPGYFGRMCECSLHGSDEACRQSRGAPVCSGRGSCVCGQCECDRTPDPELRVSGMYCECDNFSCERHNGLLCGGNGECHCGQCVCKMGFQGDACQCSTEVDRCRDHHGNLCGNHGYCICNQCECEAPYRGALCQECC